MDEGWNVYSDNTLPRRIALFKRAAGRDVALQIDWESLGECSQPRMERLDYDLEMLARGVEQARRSLPPEQAPTIATVAVRWVEGIAETVFAMEGSRLQVTYCLHGAFGADETAALLADRSEFERHVSPATPVLSPALQDLRNHRLPALFQALQHALGKPLPLAIDWSSLGHGYEAPPRLLYLLKETIGALRTLASAESHAVGPPLIQQRAQRLAQARADGVRQGISGVRIDGGMRDSTPPVSVENGILRLRVFIDPTTSSQGKLRPDYDLRVIDACKRGAIENAIADALGLRVKPFLAQIRDEDVPKLQLYLMRILNDALTHARKLKVPERARLRSLLERIPPLIRVNLKSFEIGASAEDALVALRSLETGHYNYNCDTGPFGLPFFQALKSCVDDTDFLQPFITLVKEIRMECVPTANLKEFGAAAGVLRVRQCPFQPGGMLDGDLRDSLKALVAMQEAGTLAPADAQPDVSALEDQFAALGAQLKAAFGGQLAFDFDPAICATADDARILSQQGLLPVLGAVKLLFENPGFADELPGALKQLRVLRGVRADASVTQNELKIVVTPEAGPAGWPDAVRIATALDEGLALRARAGVREREHVSRAGWQEQLRERFKRDVTLTIQWESFLAHPVEGGNRFIPFQLEDSGIRPLLYALTGYMDDDTSFRKRAKKAISEIRVSCAENAAETRLTLTDGVLQYRCFPALSSAGCLPAARIQERLYSLVFPTAGR